MNNVWFTSDLHLGHANIIKYCNRPFKSVIEMNDVIIENYNNLVGKSDNVYFLGDFAFAKTSKEIEQYLDRLNGNKFLIYGNHDNKSILKNVNGFQWQHDLRTIKIFEQNIVLCHYAMRVWDKSHYGSWQLYGHSHNELDEDAKSLSCDVGVDCWNYKPVSFQQIKQKMSTKV